MKKNIFLSYGYSSTNQEKIKMIAEAGFDGVFLFADSELENNAKLAYENGLDIETVHLPFQNICNDIWIDSPKGDEYVKEITNWIIRASQIGVDKVIFHLSQKMTPPPVSKIGFIRMRQILDVCEEYEVYLALENLRYPEYIDACLENLSSPKMICCFDCGHANAFTHNINTYNYQKYSELIKCLHIHDNDGTSDQHKLPFTGNIDYKLMMKNLKQISYDGPLTLEIICKSEETIEKEFLKKAKEALDTLEKYYNNEC